ncbi:hypothetical protein Poly41_34030 [Novipirellula artificiosorum]|uniref:Uncharacterized protein n=1 Tax=Novipirellula artificiosorum TaxID=2528016 RepID=A0A5C6DMA8_9BACT|nr:hypothetical protein Poly41_34030 [Novipirellula artificiosorum]
MSGVRSGIEGLFLLVNSGMVRDVRGLFSFEYIEINICICVYVCVVCAATNLETTLTSLTTLATPHAEEACQLSTPAPRHHQDHPLMWVLPDRPGGMPPAAANSQQLT